MKLPERLENPSDRDLRWFAGLWLPLFLSLLAGLAWRHLSPGFGASLLAAAGVVAALGLWRPALVRPLFRGWMRLFQPVGWLVSRVLLGAAFYGVITPIGWLLRVSGRAPLARGFDPDAASYWRDAPPEREPARYFKEY